MGKLIKNGFATWVQVTEHYGYITQTSWTGEPIYIVYGRVDGVFDRLATCDRDTVAEAVEECKYYERINAHRFKGVKCENNNKKLEKNEEVYGNDS